MPGKENRLVMLVDMNAFFAQIEQKHRPFLRGKPVLVGGNPGTRTVVAAASYEARPYGVKSGMPLWEARQLCPHAVAVEGNPDKYLHYTERMIAILQQFTEQVECFSVDEAFLEVGDLCYRQSPLELGWQIKRAIRKHLGLTCSVGIGPNKLCAKMAASFQKPDGLVWIRPQDLPHIFWPLPVEELFGVGPQTAAKLHRIGVFTVEELAKQDPRLLVKLFGVVGYHLHEIAHGRDASPVVPTPDPPKSMGHSYTLPQDTDDEETIKFMLLYLSHKVLIRLRQQEAFAHTLTLTVRLAGYRTFTRSRSFASPLLTASEIAQAAWQLFSREFLGCKVRLLGVSASGFRSKFQWPLSVPKSFHAQAAADQIRRKYGDQAVTLASLITPPPGLLRPKIGCFLTKTQKGAAEK